MVEADIIIQKIMCEKTLIIGMAFVTINLFHHKLKTPVLHPVTKFPSPSSKRAAG